MSTLGRVSLAKCEAFQTELLLSQKYPPVILIIEYNITMKQNRKNSSLISPNTSLTVITAFRCTKFAQIVKTRQTPDGYMMHPDVMKVLTLWLLRGNMMTSQFSRVWCQQSQCIILCSWENECTVHVLVIQHSSLNTLWYGYIWRKGHNFYCENLIISVSVYI